MFSFPGGPFHLENGKYLWLAGDPSGLYRLYVDRVVAVRHGVTGVGALPDDGAFFSLGQNHPNPARGTTVIEYTLPERQEVTLSVFSITGEKMKILHLGKLCKGMHETELDLSGLPAGTCFYRLSTPRYTATKRMVIIK